MRLIRKKTAVDRIIKYDDAGKKLKEQQGFYELSQFELGKYAFELFNFNNYNLGQFIKPAASLKLLNNDQSKLVVFGNKVVFYGAVVSFYNERLKQIDKDAEVLINILRK